MSLIPHNDAIRKSVESYLIEVKDAFNESIDSLQASSDFRNIYKVCLATDCVLEKLSEVERPSVVAARYIIRRSPILIAAGQIDAAKRDLRRFIEVVLWCVYFSDHSVEWSLFEANPTGKRADDPRQPIRYCAFRDRTFYSDYALELFSGEPSGMAKEAVTELSTVYGVLNPFAHGGHAVTAASFEPSLDDLTSTVLSEYRELFQRVCSNACITLAAFFTSQFDSLPAMNRGWFDWVVGKTRAKRLRSGRFGLPNRV